MKAQHRFSGEHRSSIPENLTDEGLYWYEILLTLFKIEKVNSKYSLKRRENVYSKYVEDCLKPIGFV